MSLWAWSATPAAGHAPNAVETGDHAPGEYRTGLHKPAAIAEDGHAHGGEKDLRRMLHVLVQDAVDHDHGQVMPAFGGPYGQAIIHRETWRPPPHPGGPTRFFLIERPPRV
ncbi:MAG: hypothetical protein AAGG65_05065 [Pseudomonadota bacterium]